MGDRGPRRSPQDLVSLLLVSAAPRLLDRDDLVALLVALRELATARAVTGLLLHGGGSFMHVLEGSAAGVGDCLEVVRDTQTDVIVLQRATIVRRRFPDWSMSFRTTEPRPVEVAGYSDFMYGTDGGNEPEDAVATLLRSFRRNHWR